MTRCYLLGAGASFGYDESIPQAMRPPRSKEFFIKGANTGILNPDWFPNLYREFQQFVDTDSELVELPKKRLKVDIEKFLQSIASEYRKSVDSDSEDEIDESTKKAYSESFYFIYEVFKYYLLMYEAETDNYRKLALSYHDNPFSVITLNYDVLFEMAAQSVGLDVRYGMDPGFNPKSIPVAKLHGSINWINRLTTPGGGNLVSLGESDNFSDVAASVQTNTIRLGEFNISSIPINMIPSLSHNDLIRSRSDIDEIALIPPFADYKDYHKISGYDKVWNYGGSILQDCDELVIIGCSIRKYDDKLITLLDENLPDEIEVFVFCGPESKKVKEKINVLSENPVLRDASGYFSDYIKKFL